jgi:hypothetical protein
VRTEAETRRLEELERERIREARRFRRQHAALLRQQQRQADLVQQQLARQLAIQQQNLIAQAIKQQYDQDNVTMAGLRAGLPALRAQARLLRLRVDALVRLLDGSGAAELAQLQLDAVELVQVDLRCDLGGQSAEAGFKLILACDIEQVELVTRQAVLGLHLVIQDHAADVAMVHQCALNAAAVEATYQNDRDTISQFPNLGLTRFLIHDAEGPVAKLSGAELTLLNTKLAAHAAVTWVRAKLPGTRVHRSGEWLYVPETLKNFPYQPSAEVFHDWIWESRAGHGQAAGVMLTYLGPIHGKKLLLGTPYTWVQATDGNRNWKVSHPNLVLNVILDRHKALLITFYKLN